MIIYRLKSENIVYDLYLPEKSNGKTVLYVPGLPGHPRKRNLGDSFAKNGFVFFEMRFMGTWESDGVFSMENCIKSLYEAYTFVKNGSGVELRMETIKDWPTEKVILMGSSFGGGVILSLDINDPLTLVLLAPLTEIKKIKDSVVILSSGDDDLFNLLSKGYANVYRGLSKSDWDNFLDGNTLINPEKTLESLKNKRLVFVQGRRDSIISHADTDRFVEKLKVNGFNTEFMTVEDAGHGADLEDKSVESLLKIL